MPLISNIKQISREFLLNLNIKQKILLGFYIFSSIFILAFVLNYNQQRKVEHLIHYIVEDNIPHIQRLYDINIKIVEYSNTISNYLLQEKEDLLDDILGKKSHLAAEFILLDTEFKEHAHNSYEAEGLHKLWLETDKHVKQLFIINNDQKKRSPDIDSAAVKLYPLRQQLDSQIELLIQQLNKINLKSKEITPLKKAVHEFRVSWSHLNDNFKLFMSTRTKVDFKNVQAYKRNVSKKAKTLFLMSPRNKDYAKLHLDKIEGIKNTLKTYFKQLNEIVILFKDNNWRTDIHFYELNILPNIKILNDFLHTMIRKEIETSNQQNTKLIQANTDLIIIDIALLFSLLTIGTILVLSFSQHITQRLKNLLYATQQATSGDLDVNLAIKGKDELSRLGNDFNIMIKSLNDSFLKKELLTTELQSKTRELESQKMALDEHDIVSIADPAGIITYVNNKFCEVSGYTKTELVGHYHNILNSRLHAKEFWQTMWQTIAHGKVWNAEIRNQKKDGIYYWVNTTIVPFLDENNKPYQYISVQTDVTKSKLAEEEARQQFNIVSAISDIQDNFIVELDERSTFDKVLNYSTKMTNSEFGFVAEVAKTDDNKSQLHILSISNIAWDKDSKEKFDLMAAQSLYFTNLDSLFGAAMLTEKPIIANMPASQPNSHDFPDGHPEIKRFLGIPIIQNNVVVGMIGVANSKEDYNEKSVTTLNTIGRTCISLFDSIKSERLRKNTEIKLQSLNIELEKRVAERTESLETAMYGMERALMDVDREKQAIQSIVSTTTVTADKYFYQTLVKNAAKALNMEYVILITYKNNDSKTCTTLAFWEIDKIANNFSYDSTDTPCEHIFDHDAFIILDKVSEKFPNDPILKIMNVKSYIGVPFYDSKGKPLGHMVAMGKVPLRDTLHHKELMKIFSARAGTELEREYINDLLELNVAHQASIADLGQYALYAHSLENFYEYSVDILSANLDIDFVKIMEYQRESDDFLLIAGTGWNKGQIGHWTVPNHKESQAGYTFDKNNIVIVDYFATETRFQEPDILTDHNIISSMSMVIAGAVEPFGVLSVHSAVKRKFTQDEARYLKAFSQIISMTITRFKADEAIEHELQIQNIISYLLQISLLDISLKQQLTNALRIMLSINTFGKKAKSCIFLLDKNNDNLSLFAQEGFPDNFNSLNSEKPSSYLCRQIPTSKKDVVFTDGTKQSLDIDFELKHLYDEYCIPIYTANKCLGILYVYLPHEQHPSIKHNDFLMTVVNTLASIIERKNAEDNLEAAYRHKSDFLSSMSHELRTPLNSIIGFSKTMLKGIDGPINDEQNESLTHIHRSGQHLLSLISNILDMSKLEAHKMELYYSDVNMDTLISDIDKTIGILAKDKGLTINVDIEDDLPLISCDETRIKQVLLNVVSNAVKFTNEGGIKIYCHHYHSQKINIPTVFSARIASENIPLLLITIKDSGVGIAKEDFHKIFEEFGQVDNSSTRTQVGTGLGMTISKQLIEMHHGEMWLESTVGKGSLFHILLPFKQPAAINETHVKETLANE